MVRNRICLALCTLLMSGGVALAQDSCKPVETAPGIKSVPAGCNKLRSQSDITGSVPKTAAPVQAPSVLFPDSTSGAVTKFGDTEVRINGRVRFEAQVGR